MLSWKQSWSLQRPNYLQVSHFYSRYFLGRSIDDAKKQLEIAHRDSNRNLASASRTRTQELTIAQITSEPMVIAYENARTGIEEISDAERVGSLACNGNSMSNC